MSILIKTPAVLTAVSTADLKTHLRVYHSDDDAYLSALVSLATQQVETYTGRALLTQTIQLRLDRFPCAWDDTTDIILPRPPVQSVSSIKYYDTANALQTWSTDEWESDAYADSPWVPDELPTRVRNSFGYTYPTTYTRTHAVIVEFVAGWEAVADLPEPLVHAIKMVAADMYEHREETVLGTGLSKHELGWLVRLLEPYCVQGTST